MNTKQIRQKILDLAIRGELVPQDPTDEPASVLLERIRAEKEQLIKDKKLKRDKKDNEPIDEVPFELPEGWEWCRLKEITTELKYGTSEKSSLEGKIPVLRMGNITTNGTIDYSNIVFSSNEEDIKEFLLTKGNLVFNRTNSSDLVGKTAIYRGEIPAIFAGYLIKIALLKVNPEYTNLVMNSSYYRKWCYSVKSDAVNQSNINAEKLSNLLISLPPLAEQHSIVEIAEQLLTIVDTIKLLQEELKALVKQAKSQVLSDAITGKLTHQDPNDEPAEELLKRIGKTTATDTPYEKLPKGWAWCRLGDITKTIATKPYQILQSEIEKNGDFPVISQSANYIEGFSSDETKVLKVEDFIIVFGDHTRVVKYIDFDFIVGADGVKVILPNNNLSKYLYYLILNASYKIENRGYSRHFQFLQKEFFPLPPLAEQYRIVQKIETYFSFLDTIENSL